MKGKGIAHIAMGVRDLEQSVKFYRDPDQVLVRCGQAT